MHVAYLGGSVLLRRGDATTREKAIWGFLPNDNASYGITFGTHTKTTEQIEMPFGLMTRVGNRYHVSDEDPIPKGEWAILGGNLAAHCTVMGHSTVRCAKTAE